MPRSARPAIVFLCVAAAFLAAILLQSREGTSQSAASKEPPATVTDRSQFIIAPYLQFPTQTSVTIMWETPAAATSVVEFGLTPADMKTIEVNSAGPIYEVKIDGLSPETNYVYRVTSTLEDGTTIKGPLSSFQTAVKDDSAYSFAVIGDTQKNPKMTAKIARVISDRHPHFVIHVGDVVDNGPDKKEWVHELFGPCADLFAHCAVFPTIGNHEKNHAWYYKYFSLPSPKYYYRYRFGNADFFVVDSNKPLKPESEQYKWLDNELGKSSAMWKFVYHHHPAWSSDADDYGDTKKGVYRFGDQNVRNLVTLYEKYKVDVVFNGHIHAYERTHPLRDNKVNRKNGVVYVTSGGGGGKLEDFAALPSWFKAQLRVDFHCCYVTVLAGRLEFKAFDHNGQLFDQFEIEK